MQLREKLEKLFDENEFTIGDTVYESYNKKSFAEDLMYGEDLSKELLEHLNINASKEKRYGGMDQGSDYWTVYKFESLGEVLYYEFYGYYASHYGTDYEGWFEVTPRSKVVTVYDEVKK